MNISDEAVEAAREQLDAMGVSVSRKYMRSALEAAAPHLASAWHDAVSAAYVNGALSADAAGAMYKANPYRSKDVGE